MCNLYRMTATVDEMKGLFGSFAGDRTNLQTRDAIYPDQTAPVIRRVGDELTMENMIWGIPGWSEKQRPITNVRNLESGFWKPMLSSSDAKVLVPVSQFCEWAGEKGAKTKVWFGMKDEPLFAFAGIFRKTGEGMRYAFLTTEPNSLVAPVHPKAMPVIIRQSDYASWLQSDYRTAVELALPYRSEEMKLTG
ncbi:hypothetical protein A9995_14010 [Erythrobacter sp. QSSC1-22B]|uniref:SOS response-associated peptidase n=1 Tax=Erythrobacter sp. QSSC1-22B TaxID=1860125 RepID=UPI000805FB80|nr:SOS response-associated peptidase family protein [Erythrobacter sp. QSSC1-22B]OBX17911.1 hypothetical protein A9995_14010 [Erythrobacter sp. QSSC1-22B]